MVIYAPSGSQTLDSRYTNPGHQLCPEHHIRLTGAAAGAPRAPQPRAGHKAPALLGHEEAGGCCRGALRNPPGKHKAPLAFPAAAVRSRMIHSPAKRSSLEEKYTREKKKKSSSLLVPLPTAISRRPVPISGVLTPGGNAGTQKTKRLGKKHYFQCGLCGGARARLRGTAARLAHVGKPFPAGCPQLQQRHFCTVASSGSLSITARSLAWCDYFWVIC